MLVEEELKSSIIFIIDLDGNLIYYNEKFIEEFGRIDKHITEKLTSDVWNMLMLKMKQAIHANEVIKTPLPFQTDINTEANLHAIRIEATDYVMIVCKKTTQNLLTNELLLNTIDSIAQGLIVFDANGLIHRVNTAFTEITGYALEEVRNQSILFFRTEQQPKYFYQKVWTTVKHTGKWEGEMWAKRKKGDMCVLWINISKIKQSNDLYVAMLTDLTAQKLSEQLLFEDFQLSFRIQEIIQSSPIKNTVIDISGEIVPAALFGGDTYAWFQLSDHLIAVLMIDVMGKGVAASLICMSIRSIMEDLISRLYFPRDVVEILNSHMRTIFRKNKEDIPYYFTAIYMLIDTKSKKISYINAGHPRAILINKDKQITYLKEGGVPIGMLPEFDYEEAIIAYEANTKIILYTDGFIDGETGNMEEQQSALESLILSNYTKRAPELARQIVQDHVNRFPVEDDLCIVCMELF